MEDLKNQAEMEGREEIVFADEEKEGLWEEGRANNLDPLGAAIFDYAEAWAELMQAEIKEGKELEEIALETSFKADNGQSGFSHACAVKILSEVWIYGEQLRHWHNKEVQIGNEDDIINEKEKGGVLNPAMIRLKQ